MMSYIWTGMIVLSFVCAIISGDMQSLSDGIISGSKSAIEMCISLSGIMCLWSGIMNIAERSGLTKIIAKMLSPIFRFVFKNVDRKSETAQIISMNITANLLGLGNAATPLGLEGMKRLQKDNPFKKRATGDMAIFVVMNSAAMRLIPTTVAMLRSENGSKNPMEIIVPTWICTSMSLMVGIMFCKIFEKIQEKRLCRQ